jgi:hypothetical protein
MRPGRAAGVSRQANCVRHTVRTAEPQTPTVNLRMIRVLSRVPHAGAAKSNDSIKFSPVQTTCVSLPTFTVWTLIGGP